MTQATLYLRDDGHLFSVNKQWWPTKPLENANIEDIESFWINVYKSEKVSVNYNEIWETCEYVPDLGCSDKKNIWRVAAGCRRSGRFFYTARKKTAKEYLEGPDENVHWIYSEIFDQFTEVYEERYQKRVKETMRRKERTKNTAGDMQKHLNSILTSTISFQTSQLLTTTLFLELQRKQGQERSSKHIGAWQGNIILT